MCVSQSALPLRADGADHQLLESVIEFYRRRFPDEPAPSQFLASRNLLHPELVATFELGYADRELGRRLPPRQNKVGRELRARLQRLGIYRGSGHGHFNGSLVVPLRSASGEVVNLYGHKTGHKLNGTWRHTWLADARGLFNPHAFTCIELILTDSVLNAMSFWCAELPNVTCTFGLQPPHEDLITALQASKLERVYLAQRNTAGGDHAAAQAAKVLATMDVELLRVNFPFDHDANDYLLATGPQVLKGSLNTAQPYQEKLTAVVKRQPAHESRPKPTGTPQNEQKKNSAKAPVQSKPRDTRQLSPPDGEPTMTDTDIRFTFDDRHYRVRGLDKNNSLQRLKVNLLVERRELLHVDSLDLYSAQARARFIKLASTEIYVEESTVKQDLAKILLQLETLQEEQLRAKLQVKKEQPKQLTDAERDEAEKLLRDPNLLKRILSDYDRCGLVGEETNKLVCYLGCVSRLLDRPLAIMIQSSSAAGKTTLMDAALAFVPPEHQIRYSAMTGQSLYYMGPHKNMKHKILAVSEEEGVAQASYALKLLQSDGKLRIAAAGKNGDTGRQQTEEYEVEGPVMMFLTTTSETPDAELQNRCITLRVNESATQTEAIHARQSARYTLAGQEQLVKRQAICQLHQNAQRLLQPKRVLIPWANQFTFRRDQTRMRRDYEKYLSLIATITLLHQYQRKHHEGHEEHEGYIVATLDDVALANRLAGEALGQSLDDLLPQTRQLLVLIDDHVTKRSHQEETSRQDLRFTQRELREAFGWSDFQIRKHLSRLVRLEYVLVFRTGHGNQRHYQLLYDGQGRDGGRFLLGLADPDQLKASYDKRTEHPNQRNEPLPSPIRAACEPVASTSQNTDNTKGQHHLRQTILEQRPNGQVLPAGLSAS